MHHRKDISPKDAQGLRVLGALFTLIGLAALIGAFYQYTETRGFLDEALSAQGLVVDWIEATSSRPGDRGETSYFSVVQFTTKDN